MEYNDYELSQMFNENDENAKDVLFEKYSYIIDIIINKYKTAASFRREAQLQSPYQDHEPFPSAAPRQPFQHPIRCRVNLRGHFPYQRERSRI